MKDDDIKTGFKAIHDILERLIEDVESTNDRLNRLSRAPERRVFYIDVGNLPKDRAEEYLRSVMNKYKISSIMKFIIS